LEEPPVAAPPVEAPPVALFLEELLVAPPEEEPPDAPPEEEPPDAPPEEEPPDAPPEEESLLAPPLEELLVAPPEEEPPEAEPPEDPLPPESELLQAASVRADTRKSVETTERLVLTVMLILKAEKRVRGSPTAMRRGRTIAVAEAGYPRPT
jgi:hypothetical protein